MRPEGLEPSTFGTGIQRSIQLNYGRRYENLAFRTVSAEITSKFLQIYSIIIPFFPNHATNKLRLPSFVTLLYTKCTVFFVKIAELKLFPPIQHL